MKWMSTRIFFDVMAILPIFFVSGCGTGKLADNISGKNVMGDGFLVVSKITVTDHSSGDFTPKIESVMIDGKIQTVIKDSNLLHYTKKSTAAWYNAKNITTVETLTVSLPEKGDMSEVISSMQKIILEGREENGPPFDKK